MKNSPGIETKRGESLAEIREECRRDERELPEAIAARVRCPQDAKRRTFGKNGKLIVLLEAVLPAGEKLYPFLRARGFCNSTISNARAAARVYVSMVASGVIAESAYDQFTWRQLRQVKRVVDSGKRTVAEVAAIMKAHPGDFAERLSSERKESSATGRGEVLSPGPEGLVAPSFEVMAARVEEIAARAGGLSFDDQRRLAEVVFALFQSLKRAEAEAA